MYKEGVDKYHESLVYDDEFALSELRKYVPPQEELPNVRTKDSIDLTINVMYEVRTIPVELETTTV